MSDITGINNQSNLKDDSTTPNKKPIFSLKQKFANYFNVQSAQVYDKHKAKMAGFGVGFIAFTVAYALIMDSLSKNPVSFYSQPDTRTSTQNPVIIPTPNNECVDVIDQIIHTGGKPSLYGLDSQILQLVTYNQALCNLTNRFVGITENLAHEYNIVRQRDIFDDDPVIWNRVADFKLQLIMEFLLSSSETLEREDLAELINFITQGNEVTHSQILSQLQGFLNRNLDSTYNTLDLLMIIKMLFEDERANGRLFCADVHWDFLISAITQRLEQSQES